MLPLSEWSTTNGAPACSAAAKLRSSSNIRLSTARFKCTTTIIITTTTTTTTSTGPSLAAANRKPATRNPRRGSSPPVSARSWRQPTIDDCCESTNPNAANSPLRPSAAALPGAKKCRSHADMLREEAYPQPPPAKRQMIDRGVASPSRSKTTMAAATSTTTSLSTAATTTASRADIHRSASRVTASTHGSQRASHASTHADYQPTQQDIEMLRQWHANTRAAFPKMVFYFESIPDDLRARLAKQVSSLGAREEKFFSIEITHVVTTRPIPPVKKTHEVTETAEEAAPANNEQPETINPSLLNRNTTTEPLSLAAARRASKLAYDAASKKLPIRVHEDPIKRPKPRSTDVLDRAREMGKKIWSLEKLQKILEYLLYPDPITSAALGLSRHNTRASTKPTDPQDKLAQALEAERVHGPSDRDPTVSNRELKLFKGPYIYVYDIDEKTKPIMAREYPKVSDPKDGEWPQFRVTSHGRCPFIIDEHYDIPEKKRRDKDRAKERPAKEEVETTAVATATTTTTTTTTAAAAAAAAAAAVPTAQAPKPVEENPPKPVTGKRTLKEMEDGHNRGAAVTRSTEQFDREKAQNPPSFDFRTNAFMSRAKPGLFLAGEPVASGLQPSNVTSAIRSQMVSSTGGVLGAKAGTSKEIHGLQRRVVLQKAVTPAVAQDVGHDATTFGRSASTSRAQPKPELLDGEEPQKRDKLRRSASMPVSQPKKRDPKPGYCENCQDKFADFEEHIVSRQHRKFAENDANWVQLDALLAQLKRVPRQR
ncbi:hsk1-interacting molecule 1-like protein [Thermochaetoides thermophila DSM 1495]|uniref:Hsk1-interacting molecule 1-like protein n=1 Tax=Chaetomium thermophilum (strain DSM 1495 / CBS 144.50 / IMI 039719) TaxID=759272 RepID=G0SA16_CHATD|nr:hsk1-interacting molecule 1-like protein [Thermochaetoides thermophila DSM 1495]EGS19588.1 hsk1-interacting molecule 1-like protein [Thermochaetoides thermophila DSM 1495]